MLYTKTEAKVLPEDLPALVFTDEKGKILDHPFLKMAGMSGHTPILPDSEELVPLPFGSTLFYMPGRIPLGWDIEKKGFYAYTGSGPGLHAHALAAFLPPGYIRTLLPATRIQEKAPVLPLWAYAAVGWKDDRFWTTGIMVDPNPHWDPKYFQDDKGLACLVRGALAKHPKNRLLRHLARCALEYHCFAAKNCFYRRWELPVPTSPACNAQCLGCLSLQPAQYCPAPHGRIKFVPTSEEILQISLPHLEEAEDPIVSFGQGCEGEPLLQSKTILEVIKKLRAKTQKGIINLNTNGSRPNAVAQLCQSGLDSVRVTINSPDQTLFNAYHKPIGFTIDEIKRSLILAKEIGANTAINLLVFPGVTDTEAEKDRLVTFIRETGIDQIQMRNLNIDPELYLSTVQINGPRYKLRQWMADLKEAFPDLTFGYFNKSKQIVG